MIINLDTRIKTLLDAKMEPVIESLVKLNRNFSKLRNPVLRNLFARRITISEACKIAKCNPTDFLNSMKEIGFNIDEGGIKEPSAKPSKAIDFNHTATTFEFDARPFLTQDRDPLKEILKLTSQLQSGERLKIINTFEPIPLIHLLVDNDFLYFTEIVNEALTITWFEKTNKGHTTIKIPQEIASQKAFDTVLSRYNAAKIKYIDVRKLEMPLPMLQIMEHIERLNVDELLYVYHKKVPAFLLPELQKKGLAFLLNQKKSNELDMLIYSNEQKRPL